MPKELLTRIAVLVEGRAKELEEEKFGNADQVKEANKCELYKEVAWLRGGYHRWVGSNVGDPSEGNKLTAIPGFNHRKRVIRMK